MAEVDRLQCTVQTVRGVAPLVHSCRQQNWCGHTTTCWCPQAEGPTFGLPTLLGLPLEFDPIILFNQQHDEVERGFVTLNRMCLCFGDLIEQVSENLFPRLVILDALLFSSKHLPIRSAQ